MKLTAIILLTACLQASALGGYSQRISLTMKDVTLEKVFAEIQKQSDYSFIYNNEQASKAGTISVVVKNATIQETLDKCFQKLSFTYSIVGNIIVVKEKGSLNVFLPAEKDFQGELGANIDVKGRVVNEQGDPVAGVTVSVKGSTNSTVTNAKGEFSIIVIDEDATLVFTHVTMETFELKVNGKTEIVAKLKTKISELGIVEIVSTGYQDVPKERATGSFNKVDNELFNRRVSTNIMNRIENLTPGLSFGTPRESAVDNPYAILIRGRSSIFSSTAPLIVVDNFPYDGNINNINPNDVESVTILKDAAAASIWGARAGNGVIVITTKRGKTTRLQVEFNSNITIQSKPDLFNASVISSADYIELERFLFSNNYTNYYRLDDLYNSRLKIPQPFTPVVDLLIAKRDGLISPAEADERIESLKAYDARNDITNHLYRNSINRQHAINISGSTPHTKYYVSGGWDHNLGTGNLVGTDYNRVTLRSQNQFTITDKLQVEAGLNFTQTISKSGNNPGIGLNTGNKGLYPYARLVDDEGNALQLVNNNRIVFTDTVSGGGKILDWKYRPIEDIDHSEFSDKIKDYLVNVGVRYQILKSLDVQLKYQYENSINNSRNLYGASSYFSRNLSNSFFQPSDPNQFPIPIGAIIDNNSSEINSHQGRAQVNYLQTFNRKHQIAAIAGWEIKDISTRRQASRIYGYKEQGSLVNTNINFTQSFVQYNNIRSTNFIPTVQSIGRTLDRFLSGYINASYNYDKRYTVSISARNDAANLFGVSTNQKGVPLWSAGLAWQLSNEDFYKIPWIPYLKFRTTYGYNGNFSRATTALSTISFSNSFITPAIIGTVQQPPNKELRWEQVRVFNIGLDFSTRFQRISGSIEYYQKNAKDLIAPAPVDPTLGLLTGGGSVTSIYKNVASMQGSGLEIELNSRIIDHSFKWITNFIFTKSTSKVTDYLTPVSTNSSVYLNPQSINPIIGKPVYAMYSYYWAGLDPGTGDPRGYIGKEISKNWSAIIGNTRLDSLKYSGPVQPTIFGALRNTFSWKGLSLSINISYKMGYYIRKPSIDYTSLFTNWTGHGDYSLRWQNPGDEMRTNVPSAIFPANNSRDQFYTNSEVHVLKGDHIRLEDVRLDYMIDNSKRKKIPFKQFQIYLYANNLGTIWVSNKGKIDPDFNNIPKIGKSIALGMNFIF